MIKKIIKIIFRILLILLAVFGIKHLFIEGNFNAMIESIKSDGFITFIVDFFKNFFVP